MPTNTGTLLFICVAMGIGIFLHTQAYIFIGNSIVSTFCISSSQYRIVLHLQQPPAMARSK